MRLLRSSSQCPETSDQKRLFTLCYALIIVLLSLLTSTCLNPFNPDISDGETVHISNSTPAEVLHNLMDAYNQKNIEIYKKCLSTDFCFYVSTQQIPELGTDWWGYQQEIDYHTNLFSHTTQEGKYPPPSFISLSLEIPPETMWEVTSEGVVIISCHFYLMLTYVSVPDMVATGYARFHLKQIGDGWYISIWFDNSYI